MGATNFYYAVKSRRRKPETVFSELQEQARHEYGHGGYTGTIAEVCGFEDVTDQYKGKRMRTIENDLLEKLDKWGPCALVRRNGTFHFMGWAST